MRGVTVTIDAPEWVFWVLAAAIAVPVLLRIIAWLDAFYLWSKDFDARRAEAKAQRAAAKALPVAGPAKAPGSVPGRPAAPREA